MFIAAHPAQNATPFSSATPPSTATTPSQMRHFYGVDNVNLAGIVGDGTGQTIAIVDVYDDPNARSDLHAFDTFYGLADPPSFLKYNQNGQLLIDSGGSASPPSVGSAGNGWQIETSLDIEWAHVIAPKANIALFEAVSASSTSLFTAVASAAATPGVVAISMSWGTPEFSAESSSDSSFAASNVVYLAATGDNGASATTYPAASANVVAVGGTTMHFASGTTDGTFGSETAWSGTGGRLSPYEPKPTYQNNVLTGTKRGTPDISMDADPATGVAVYDTFDFGTSAPWAQYGGTSLATPMWAALVAIMDQGRANVGLSPLSGKTGLLPNIYSAPAADYHDITSGSNGTGNSATTGYDTVTGWGTPIANKLLNDLSAVPQTNRLVFTAQPAATVAGTAIDAPTGVQVSVVDPAGHTVTNDSSTVTVKLNGGTFAGGGNTATAQAVNGVATFPGLVINTVGSYTLSATDGTFGVGTSSSFVINSAPASSLTFGTGPSDTTAGVAISPAVVVKLFDPFGNLATTDTSLVTMSVVSGPAPAAGTTTVQASNGSAVFSNLILNTIGSYTIRASDGPITGPVSSTFNVRVGPAAKLAFVQQPTSTTTGNVLNPAVTVYVEDAGGNLITSVIPTVTLTLSTGTFADGSTTESALAANGVAVFNTLKINDAATYTLTASANNLNASTSLPFTLTFVDVVNVTSANVLTLSQDPDGKHFDWKLGNTAGAIPASDPNGLTVNGDGAVDSIYLDYSNGNPFPGVIHLNGAFTVDRLQGPSPFAGTTMEIGQGTLYFVYSPGQSLAPAVRSALAGAYNAGAWKPATTPASGLITSSFAAAAAPNTLTLGYADSADGVISGQPANTVEVRYTLTGDANLDRKVDSTDAITTARNYLVPGASAWDLGNFNYDNAITLADVTLLQKNLNTTLTLAAVNSAASSPTSTIPSRTIQTAPTSPTSSDTSPEHLKKRSTDRHRVETVH